MYFPLADSPTSDNAEIQLQNSVPLLQLNTNRFPYGHDYTGRFGNPQLRTVRGAAAAS